MEQGEYVKMVIKKDKYNDVIKKDVVEYGDNFNKEWEKKDIINRVTFGGQIK